MTEIIIHTKVQLYYSSTSTAYFGRTKLFVVERLTSDSVMAPVGKEIPPRATVEDEEQPAEQNGAGLHTEFPVDSMSEVNNLYVRELSGLFSLRYSLLIHSFAQMFSRHEFCLTSHLELTKCAMGHVVPDSDAFRAISSMLDRTRELIREVESIKTKLVRRGPCLTGLLELKSLTSTGLECD